MFVQNTLFLPSEAWFDPELVRAIHKLARDVRATGFTQVPDTLGGYLKGDDTCSPDTLNPLVLVAQDTEESWSLIAAFVQKARLALDEQWIYVTRTPVRVADVNGHLS